GCHTHNNRREHEHVRQWVGVHGHAICKNWRRAIPDLAHTDVHDYHRGLKNVQTDDLLDEIAVRDHDVETCHHQQDDNPVIIQAKYRAHSASSLRTATRAAKSK